MDYGQDGQACSQTFIYRITGPRLTARANMKPSCFWNVDSLHQVSKAATESSNGEPKRRTPTCRFHMWIFRWFAPLFGGRDSM